MRFFGLIFLFLFVTFASANPTEENMYLVFKNGPNSVTIYTTPCVSEKVTQWIKPEAIKFYQRARVFYELKEYQACWRVEPSNPELVFIVDEDMDTGTLPIASFKRPEMI